jgi:hypothetical protein
MALVRGVMAASINSGSRLKVSSVMSTKIGMAFTVRTALTVAIKV